MDSFLLYITLKIILDIYTFQDYFEWTGHNKRCHIIYIEVPSSVILCAVCAVCGSYRRTLFRMGEDIAGIKVLNKLYLKSLLLF